MNTSQVNFNIVNDAISPGSPKQGIIFVQGTPVRGPIADPSDIIVSPRKFRAIFGNSTNLFNIICLGMLDRGAYLRVNRVVGGTPVAATSPAFMDVAIPLFQVVAKHAGADYNNVKATVLDATNGDADTFNLKIEHIVDTQVVELYENLKIIGHPTIAQSDYLKKVTANSDLVSIVYSDLSAQITTLRPDNGNKTLTTGADGTAPAISDYTGTKADQNGFYAFDPYDDSYALVCPAIGEGDLTGLGAAGNTYASSRKDMLFYLHLTLDSTTSTALIAEKPVVDSKYLLCTSGGFYQTHPVSSEKIEVPEIGYVLATMAKVHRELGEWRAFFGPTYGEVTGVLGVVNNFGSNANFDELNLLANSRINMVVTKNSKTYLQDAFTMEVTESPTNFASVMNAIFFIMKTLKPTLEAMTAEPLDFTLAKNLYFRVKPFLDSLVTGRAIEDYSWEGDQFETSTADLKINNATDWGLGKYKVNFKLIFIAPLREVTINIILAKAGTTIEIS